jgi:membrane fusion protein, multidrug efflux system
MIQIRLQKIDIHTLLYFQRQYPTSTANKTAAQDVKSQELQDKHYPPRVARARMMRFFHSQAKPRELRAVPSPSQGPWRRVAPCSLLLVAGLVLAGCNEDAKQGNAPEQLVKVDKAALTQYQPIAEVSGQVEARVQTDLAFRISGKIIARNVDIGSHVRAGDVLMKLDNSQQQADVTIAEASLRAAQAGLKQKTLSFERYQTLYASRDVSQQVFDQAQQEMITAQASLEAAEAVLATAKDTLSYTELKADANGIITARNVEVGGVVSAAQAALTIAHDGPRDAVFDVYEAFFLNGEPSKDVDVSSLNDPGHKVTATIRETSPVIDSTAGTIRVKLTLPEGASWPLGTTVIGNFRAPTETGMVLPWSAMSSQDGGSAVWVVDPKIRAIALRAVKIARYRAGDFVVSDGLAPGDLVVTDGGKVLRPDEVVDWKGR